MKDSIPTLIQLSEIDCQIEKLNDAQKRLPLVTVEIQNHILKFTKDLETARGKIQAFETAKTEAEQWILEKQDWIKQREERNKDIKTNKEFQASLKEVASAKKEILDKTNAMKLWDTQKEDAQKQAEQLEATLTPKIEDLKSKHSECEEKLKMVGPRLEEKEDERTELVKNLKPEIYASYTAIQSKTNPALANAAGKVCSECGNRIPPQVFNQLHADTALQFCAGCKRILYLMEAEG